MCYASVCVALFSILDICFVAGLCLDPITLRYCARPCNREDVLYLWVHFLVSLAFHAPFYAALCQTDAHQTVRKGGGGIDCSVPTGPLKK